MGHCTLFGIQELVAVRRRRERLGQRVEREWRKQERGEECLSKRIHLLAWDLPGFSLLVAPCG